MSTSKLQRKTYKFIAEKLIGFEVIENYRPDWLNFNGFNLELDIFIPELSIAIEVQGQQHYQFVSYFHGSYANFKQQQTRDEVKRTRCIKEGIVLFEIADTIDFDYATEEIINMASQISEAIQVIERVYDFKQHKEMIREASAKVSGLSNSISTCKDEKVKKVLRVQLQLHQQNLMDLFASAPSGLRDKLRHKSNGIFASRRTPKIRRRSCGHLKIHQVSESLWIVWGGRNLRTVEVVNGKLICDCQGFPYTKDTCRHCRTIKRRLNGDLRVKKVESIAKYT